MLKQFFTRYKRQRRLRHLLANREMADVLNEAPYGYGHFQGEDGFRIWDERLDPGFVHFAPTAEKAELWIVERYLCEVQGQS